MKEETNLFGCFFKVGFDPNLREQDFSGLADSFRPFIWGEHGICNALKKLRHEDYGQDLKLVLFQFYVKPTLIELHKLKEIEPYRKREQAIGIPIVINQDNFFCKTDALRFSYLKESILQKVELLAEVVKQKKLDTKMDLLRTDLLKALTG